MGWIYIGAISDLLNIIFAVMFLLDSVEVATGDSLRYWHSIVLGLSALFSYLPSLVWLLIE